jgi:hypothetical protein
MRQRLPGSQPAENYRPRQGVIGIHRLIIANCSTRVELDNYKASYFMV